ncbi:MAG: penicillin-binding transpeptidase domain-containing protein, partial [Clostridia bacterium]|nr:penicillin-binding transpeptidase domain-containing protein [Clostridia bacterium]
SVFKMLVGIAALEEGKTTPRETIYDRIKYAQHAIKCWSSRGHGSINLMDALKVSCNYYFTAIGARMNIWDFHEYAKAYGLHGSTGLELLQLDGRSDYNRVANPDVRENIRRSNAYYTVKNDMRTKFELELSDEQVWDLIDIDRSYSKLLDYLKENEVFESAETADEAARRQLYIDATQRLLYIFNNGPSGARWSSDLDYYHVFVGQSDTSVSPLAVSRYIAALVNGSRVMETHVLKEVRSPDGKIVDKTQPKYDQLDIKEEHTAAIKEGMRRVVYNDSGPGGRGSAQRAFAGLDPEITLGGKTGTAQVIPNITERNTAWFASFTPYENPEVAVVVAVPNGRTSGNAAPVARRIIEEYYKLKKSEQKNTLPAYNELVQ